MKKVILNEELLLKYQNLAKENEFKLVLSYDDYFDLVLLSENVAYVDNDSWTFGFIDSKTDLEAINIIYDEIVSIEDFEKLMKKSMNYLLNKRELRND